MIVRKIKPEEFQRTNELFGISFEFEVDNSKTGEEKLRELSELPFKGRHDIYFAERWAAFEDDDKTMMSFIVTTPYDMNFDGNICKMTGIGGVSTLPQYRRHGGIRACFEASLKSMYKEGYDFSYLYPFSTGYYGKFGYELCDEVTHYFVNLRSIKPFDIGGGCCIVEHGSHLEDIKKVYNDYKQGYNLMCEREDCDYKWAVEANPAKTREYIYVYKNAEGEAKGVISFTKEKREDNRFDMRCKRFYFSDTEGFKGLLNFSLAFSSYYEHIIFILPQNLNITSFIPEWALYSYKRESYFNGMVRVVNVESVLSKAKYQGSGSLVIAVSDKQIAENDGTFKVTFKDGKATEVTRVSEPCDIELDIRDFSRFIIGTHDVNAMRFVERVKINGDLEKISKVFYNKPHFIADYF